MPPKRGKRKAPERTRGARLAAAADSTGRNLDRKYAVRRRIAEHCAPGTAHAPYGNGTEKPSEGRTGSLFENEERDVTQVKKLASFRGP